MYTMNFIITAKPYMHTVYLIMMLPKAVNVY